MTTTITSSQGKYIFDGVRSIRTDLIECIEPHKRGRVVRTRGGRKYVSEGDALDLIDLLS